MQGYRDMSRKWIFILVILFALLITTIGFLGIPGFASTSTYYYYAFVPPPEWKQASEDAMYILQRISTNLLTGVNATEIGSRYDANEDGLVNIVDVYLILKKAGLITKDPPKLPSPIAQVLYTVLQSLYGPQLMNYPTLEGRVYLLYMLCYLPQT